MTWVGFDPLKCKELNFSLISELKFGYKTQWMRK